MSTVTEQELQAIAVAPRVTKAQIDAKAALLTYRFEQPADTTSTFAHAYLGSFYLASGHSACVSKENYNQEIGERLARQQAETKAINKLWELEGYALHKQLNPGLGTTFKERLVFEQWELADRYGKLSAFISGEQFATLPEQDQVLLMKQQGIMAELHLVLTARLARV